MVRTMVRKLIMVRAIGASCLTGGQTSSSFTRRPGPAAKVSAMDSPGLDPQTASPSPLGTLRAYQAWRDHLDLLAVQPEVSEAMIEQARTSGLEVLHEMAHALAGASPRDLRLIHRSLKREPLTGMPPALFQPPGEAFPNVGETCPTCGDPGPHHVSQEDSHGLIQATCRECGTDLSTWRET